MSLAASLHLLSWVQMAFLHAAPPNAVYHLDTCLLLHGCVDLTHACCCMAAWT